MPTVEIIEPTLRRSAMAGPVVITKKRVAAYARVSTDQDEQMTSYGNQIEYYTQYIQGRDDWDFVEVYSDEGISGLSTKHREGFNRMMEDAMNDRIDLILTKSVSRFARNTLDTLNAVRTLKDKGVEVFFEKEGIYTLDNKGEMFLTITATLAQEESRSISENVTWGKRKLMARGAFCLPYANFLGYERGPDGKPKIVEKQAETVRRIYNMFLEGSTAREIARSLQHDNIPVPSGKNYNWHSTTVMHILQNEKYKGAALLQKTFTEDFLTKKRVQNNGEVRQYWIEHSHPTIISPEVFDRVQVEIEQRCRKSAGRHSDSPFDRKVFCGSCGNILKRRLWCTTSRGRIYAWACANKAGTNCETPAIREDDLTAAFLIARNRRYGNVSTEFEESDFYGLVEVIKINSNGEIEVCFQDGTSETISRSRN